MAQLTQHPVPRAPAQFCLQGAWPTPFPFLPAASRRVPNPALLALGPPTLHACLCLLLWPAAPAPPPPMTFTDARVLIHTSVHRELRQELQKAQKALYWGSLRPAQEPGAPPPLAQRRAESSRGNILEKIVSMYTWRICSA